MGMPASTDSDADPSTDYGGPAAAAPPPAAPKSLHSLAAEAMAPAGGHDTEVSREERARKALECDCVAELRDGPCGSQFSEAFYCFLTSTASEQGSDCVKPFIAMQTCMTANPEAFVQYRGSAEGGNQQDGPPVPSPPAGSIRNPISKLAS